MLNFDLSPILDKIMRFGYFLIRLIENAIKKN